MGGVIASVYNPYEIPSFLLSKSPYKIARTQKISVRVQGVQLKQERNIDLHQMESVDLSDDNDFEVCLDLNDLKFPIHRQYTTCLLLLSDQKRKVISCTGKDFKSVCNWLNKHKDDYNAQLWIYCKRGEQQYLSAIEFDRKNQSDRYLLVWARRIGYAKDRTAENVPVILREYKGFENYFDLFLCLPDHCLFLHQRKLWVNLHQNGCAVPGKDGFSGERGRG